MKQQLLFDIYYFDTLVARAFTSDDAISCTKGLLAEVIYNENDIFYVIKQKKKLFSVRKTKTGRIVVEKEV